MMKRVLLACSALLILTLSIDARENMYATYQTVQDEDLFLIPFVQEELSKLSGKLVLDAGCGTGFWAIEAAKSGAHVCGLDDRIEMAQIAIAQAGVEEQIALTEGDLYQFPYDNDSFDEILSIDATSQLPETAHFLTEDYCQTVGLGAYLQEIYRVLKPEGKAIIVIPASLDVVFTDQSRNEHDIFRHIHQVLARIGNSMDPREICDNLNELQEVKRATFAHRGGKLVLVANENDLQLGEVIWRKTPEGIACNYYHSETEYVTLFETYGLRCTEIKRPSFYGKIKWEMFHNTLSDNEIGLGSAYMNHNPFTFFYVEKVDSPCMQ